MIEAVSGRALILGAWLIIGASSMPATKLNLKASAFAVGGGGNRVITAITQEPGREGYAFGHWAGFFTTQDLRAKGLTVVRPSPPFLLVSNGPVNMESRNQDDVEELVRWEPDGRLISTGILYSRSGKGMNSAQFREAAAKLLAN